MSAGTDERRILEYVDATAPILLLRVAPEGRVTHSNQYTRQLMGRDPAGLTLGEVLVDFEGTLDLAAMSADGQREHLVNVQTAGDLPETFYVRVVGSDGGSLMLGRQDVSELHRLQRDVIRLNQNLANLTRRLQKANADLARLNELKNQFLGMAAHDLRKPAGLVLGVSELLVDDLADSVSEENAEFLRILLDAGQEMVRLIEDFLDVSIIESGKLSVSPAPARPAKVIENALRYVEIKAQRKGVEVVVEDNSAADTVELDSPKIGQVIANFVSNAVEHSEPGKRVWLGCRIGEGQAVFFVRDEGQGIAEDKLASLFQPFSKAGTKKTQGERSIGLGLAIAKKIVDAHGGRIWAESQPGQGATFLFSIPMAQAAEEGTNR